MRVFFPEETDNVYLPSISVIVPTAELPFTVTFTPINGSCFESVTVPVIVLFCAYRHCVTINANTKHNFLKSKCSLFFISIHLGLINKDSKFLNKILSFTLPCKGEDYIDFAGEKYAQIG